MSHRVTRSIGETGSSLGASSLQNFSAVSSSHSFSETVFLVSLSFLRLICSLHDLHLLRLFFYCPLHQSQDDRTKAGYIIY